MRYVNSNFGPLVEPFADNGKLKVLVIGDSNGGDFLNIVAEAGLLDSVDLRTQAVLHMCQPVLSEDPLMFQTRAPPGLQSCEANLAPVKRDPRLRAADVVILAGMWPVWAVKRLPETIDYLRKHSHARIAVFGTKGVSQDGVTYLARNARASDLLTRSYSIEPTIATRNGMLAVEARNARVEFYDPTELLCRPKCPFLTPDGHLVMWDTFHLTKAGARMLAQRLRAEWAHQLFRPVGAMR